MKPSERIKQIQEEGEKEINLDGPGLYYKVSKFEALVQYLDEEWEKKQRSIKVCPSCFSEGGCVCV